MWSGGGNEIVKERETSSDWTRRVCAVAIIFLSFNFSVQIGVARWKNRMYLLFSESSLRWTYLGAELVPWWQNSIRLNGLVQLVKGTLVQICSSFHLQWPVVRSTQRQPARDFILFHLSSWPSPLLPHPPILSLPTNLILSRLRTDGNGRFMRRK